MYRTAFIALLFFTICAAQCSTSGNKLKVFISVDMEGLAGLVSGSEIPSTRDSGSEYEYFRDIMTQETNAAIEGALAAGAAEIVVRDGHGSKQNIIPGLLNNRAKLLRGSSAGPKNMMESIDETFDAVVFIGYHAKAGTPDAVIAHTSTGNVIDFSINGVSLPEAGYNALIAGLYDVPVVFAAGDRALCEQVKALFGDVETVQTKDGIGIAESGLHPQLVREMIRTGVEKALRERKRFKPYTLIPPYTMVLKVKQEKPLYPGAQKTGTGECTFTSGDLLEVMNAFNAMK